MSASPPGQVASKAEDTVMPPQEEDTVAIANDDSPAPAAAPSPAPPREGSAPESPAKAAAPQLDDMFADDDDVAPPAPAQAPSYASSASGAQHQTPISRSQSRTPAQDAASRASTSRSPSPHANPLEYEEEDYDVPQQIQITANLELPKIPQLTSSDRQHWVMRLPPAVTIQPQPYHPDVYRSQIAEQQDAEDAGAQTQKEKRAVALKRMNEVANTVRWRWQHGSGGVPVRRSNARIVRWSDGSSSLQIGSDFWEVDKDVAIPGAKPFTGQPLHHNGSLNGVDGDAVGTKNEADSRSGGVSLLLANDRLNQVVVGQAIVTGELSLVPAGPAAVKRQQRVQLAIDSTVKKAGIKTWNDTSGIDPEQAQLQRERERRKGRPTARAQPTWNVRASTGRAGGGAGGRSRVAGGGAGGRRMARGGSFTDSDLEEEEGGIGTSRPSGGSGYRADGFVISDEEEEVDTRPSRKSKSSKRHTYTDDEEEEDMEEDEEEEDMDVEETPEPLTELERAEMAAEEIERERRRLKSEQKKNKASKPSKAQKSSAVVEDDDAMDVDSDEEMQARAPPTQKRVLQFEDDEEDE